MFLTAPAAAPLRRISSKAPEITRLITVIKANNSTDEFTGSPSVGNKIRFKVQGSRFIHSCETQGAEAAAALAARPGVPVRVCRVAVRNRELDFSHWVLNLSFIREAVIP